MTEEFESYKGIRPGKVIERLLSKRNIDKRAFALALPVPLRTFNSNLQAKRSLTTILSLKIERALELNEGCLMTLQVFHDIKLARLELQGPGPDVSKGIFWDVNFDTIDWRKYEKFVIVRVYERGDRHERDEVDRYYGIERVNQVLEGKIRLPSGGILFWPHT
jgi:antitoxin HigA-1